MAHRIELIGVLSPGDLLHIHAFGQKEFGNDLELRPRQRAFKIEFEAVGAIAGVVGTVAAIVSLLFQIRQQAQGVSWSLMRLREEVSTECARRGLPAVEMTSIINFEALLNATDEPCKLRIRSSDGTELDMYVFNDGSKYTIQVN